MNKIETVLNGNSPKNAAVHDIHDCLSIHREHSQYLHHFRHCSVFNEQLRRPL